MSLKEKTISGVIWNAVSNFSTSGIEFIVGIILARLLTPKEFGLIGTITIVIVLSEVFINSGFNQALIRKQNCTQKDYSTAFFFNFFVAVFLFFVLLVTAQPISLFFDNSDLKPLIQVLGFGLIISSFTLVQQATLTKRIDFKLQTKVNLTASILSGIVGIGMALTGFGVWSLVARSLSNRGLISIFLWVWNKWKPEWIFSKESFKELFGFGSKLLASGLIGTLLNNINYIVIAKYFTQENLGYFTRAEGFKNIVSQNIMSVATTVSYPVLATVQNDKIKLKNYFRKMLTNTFFVIIVILSGIAATSESLIVTLIGEKWLPSVELLQLLCLVGTIAPLNSMNVNILNVVGRSDLYLKLQLIVQVLAIPNIVIGILLGVKALIIGMFIISLIGYIIFNYNSNKYLNYSLKEQIKDILPSFILGVNMGVVVYLFGHFTSFNPLLTFFSQIIVGAVIIIFSGEVFKIKEYRTIKDILKNKIIHRNS